MHNATTLGEAACRSLGMRAAAGPLRTWRLEAVIDQASWGDWSPPTDLHPGDRVAIDFDVLADAPRDWLFFNAVSRLSINGHTTAARGYVAADGLGLSATLDEPWHGVHAVSLTHFATLPARESLADVLADYAEGVAQGASHLRLDLERHAVWGSPCAFSLLPVVDVPDDQAVEARAHDTLGGLALLPRALRLKPRISQA